MLIDHHCPRFDVRESCELEIPADLEGVGKALRNLDLGESRIIRTLFRLRGLPEDGLRLEGLSRVGFEVLGRQPDDEITLGLIGRFWNWRERPRPFAPEEFREFSEPGYAKAAWNYKLVPLSETHVLLRTETRVQCTDEESRKKFRRYWWLVRPFSGLIRRRSLQIVRRNTQLAHGGRA
jgi:hypothetical protein